MIQYNIPGYGMAKGLLVGTVWKELCHAMGRWDARRSKQKIN